MPRDRPLHVLADDGVGMVAAGGVQVPAVGGFVRELGDGQRPPRVDDARVVVVGAQAADDDGLADVLWVPGQNR